MAVVAVDHSSNGTVYTGLAINHRANRLYAANFTPNGHVVAFNPGWHQLPFSLEDPELSSGYAPYNVVDMEIDGEEVVLVAFEPIGANGLPMLGAGNGVVAEFHPESGRFIRNLITGGMLNIPWGVAMAPSTFGQLANDLLVGNFGDGTINAYDPHTGDWPGTLNDSSGKPIRNGALWALAFGNAPESILAVCTRIARFFRHGSDVRLLNGIEHRQQIGCGRLLECGRIKVTVNTAAWAAPGWSSFGRKARPVTIFTSTSSGWPSPVRFIKSPSIAAISSKR